ncbi:Organic radical activating enzyme [Capnocytophaga haemolytica]|jgi:radical SAM domain protein|uniref:7-carboxy-7-deazaguanine synthase n=1 Tax=Capnocytophaga haemolytica TaxID=45243 RepID=A0AAX2H216_9FLAO|nr:7-carboxy-7-deazaguanine synthase QueE [Capnocytophaga haemolytica]AMD85925.1 7-carboxy-7-deazaguanine synthase [Capnocytophaga haemolytica]SFO03129.1 Organic radical activating enzyme [Capnocytophaga haemolytica]SNV15262.1 7-carboxy-7-deazaguanine synthase [Capnocytophaga haemolytica]
MLSSQTQIALRKGEILPVMEAFYTLQGEGFYKGTAAYFIRLGGCDVGCHWCDVKESWEAEKHPILQVRDIVEEALKHSKTIIITGGEPLMWNLDLLTKYLKEGGARIHIETSGAHPLSGDLDWICLSPKKLKLPKEEVFAKTNELKMIIYNNNDFLFAEQMAAKVSSDCLLYLQPEWSKREKVIPKIVDYVMAHPQWKASLQMHKYLEIP